MRLIIARHCETDWNVARRIQGVTDNPLNARGWRQAALLARKLAGRSVEAVYASNLVRAMQTAQVVAASLRAPLISDERLREYDYGSLEGASRAKFLLTCGIKNIGFWPNPTQEDFSRFGGERGTDVAARMEAALRDMAKSHGSGTAMLVGHGRSLRTLLVPLGHKHRKFHQGTYLEIEV